MGKPCLGHSSHLGEEIVFQAHRLPWLLLEDIIFEHE
jgi:hypothetical protein